MPPPPASFASALTLSAVSLWCKAFLALTTRRFHVDGLENLYDALHLSDRGGREGPATKRRGVLTSKLAV